MVHVHGKQSGSRARPAHDGISLGQKAAPELQSSGAELANGVQAGCTRAALGVAAVMPRNRSQIAPGPCWFVVGCRRIGDVLALNCGKLGVP